MRHRVGRALVILFGFLSAPVVAAEPMPNVVFFLYLSHFAVHDPIQGRKDLVEKYQRKLDRMPKSEGPPFLLEGNPDDEDPRSRTERAALIKDKPYRGHQVLPNRMIKVKQRQDNVEFAAMVEGVDESFGRVRAKLESLGIDDHTIVVFTSDNRAAIYWHFPHYSNHGMQSPGGAIRCGDYKLLEYFENGTVQLFYLAEDPGEQHDLASQAPKTVARLKQMLHDWRSDVAQAASP